MNSAMLVGINHYLLPGNDLQGCINDVNNIRHLLTIGCGFSVLQVKTLVDEQAVKKSIMDSLALMVEQAQPGDHLVFAMSSHGAQVPAAIGDETEPDHMTEIICPHDFDWVPEHYITDDEMHAICAQLNPDATLDVILDSCHSGTMLRDPDPGVARSIPYPFELPIMPGTTTRMLKDHDFENVALWAGCREDQTSADAFIGGEHQGALSYVFTKNIFRFGCPRTRVNLISKMKLDLNRLGYEQEPQLEVSEEMGQKEIFT